MLTPKARFLSACHCQPVDRPPIWLMRQAGRYLPEYQAIRKKYSTKEMMQTPEIASDITVLPIKTIGVDAAILYSDILMIPDALGMGLKFVEGEGPRFKFCVNNQEALNKLQASNLCDRLDYVFEAIRLSLNKLPTDFPLIGFAGAPFTTACYMIAGGAWNDFSLIKDFIKREARVFFWIMDLLTDVTIECLVKQVEAGACVVQLFDTWAGQLTSLEYCELARAYSQRIFYQLEKKGIPSIHFVRDGGHLLNEMFTLPNNVISVGAEVSLAEVFKRTKETKRTKGTDYAVQGNFNPEILLTNQKTIEEETEKMLSEVSNPRQGYIVNLGHGVLPETPVENVKFFVRTIRELF